MRLHPLIVDAQQKRPDPVTWAQMLTQHGVTAQVGRLDLGDFAWRVEGEDGRVEDFVVEHKSARDLANSTLDGRLMEFVQAEVSAHRALLLVWSGRAFSVGQRTWGVQDVEALLFEVMWGWGIPVLRAFSNEAAAAALAGVVRWSAKDDHRSLDRPAPPQLSSSYPSPEARDRVGMLMSFPFWGETRARAALASCHDSVSLVMDRIQDGSLAEVEGFGPGLVEKARTFLNGG